MKRMLSSVAVVCALLLSSQSPALAAHHKHKHHTSSHKSSHVNQAQVAQRHLINLGYLTGRADGVMGSKTVKAIKAFQRDHNLPANGKLTTPTYNRLVEADMARNGAVTPRGEILGKNAPLATGQVPDFYAAHPDFYGYVDPQHANPMGLSNTIIGGSSGQVVRTQTLPSRFAKLDVSETNFGSTKNYNVTVNGQPLIYNEDQPAVIGISRTFELRNEDAIVFSTFRAGDTVCPYRHYLLTLRAEGQNLQEIKSCTRGYQARINGNSLFVTFPDADSDRAVGGTWRYEAGDLERL